tara:strand:- start:7358 stop:7585 length:228 start_codon:yes stop_codon:yes gene_type:complete
MTLEEMEADCEAFRVQAIAVMKSQKEELHKAQSQSLMRLNRIEYAQKAIKHEMDRLPEGTHQHDLLKAALASLDL